MEEILAKWPEILNKIHEDEGITDVLFNTFILPSEVCAVRGDKVYIVVSTEQIGLNYFVRRFKDIVTMSILSVTDHLYEVVFITAGQREELLGQSADEPAAPQASLAVYKQAHLYPSYTFDTFVVGNNNRTAHAACLAVADNPGEIYNPLFIYGGAGLGKTHLMHSIGHYVLQQNPDRKVLCVTMEEFTNEVIEAIRSGNGSSMPKVREKYRTVDVLLIDDIQFVIGKDTTQEEFFHTFNELQNQRKAIVLTSDRPPKEMETLDERFRSRFEWGLMVDIQPPDYETRMAILRKKAESDNFRIDDEILQYIAENIRSNIRELEGALTKLRFCYNLEKKEITLDVAKAELQSIISPEQNKVVTADLIIDVVCEHFQITREQIESRSRSADVAKPRQIAMYLCKSMTSLSQEAIGQKLGKKDHSTVIHGIRVVEKEYQSNENVRRTIDTIRKKINPN